jgi:hypothetical protein
MKIYYRILIFLAVLVINVGCSAQLSFEELTKDTPSVLNLQSYSSSKMEYSISLPNRFELAEKDQINTGFELFFDTLIEFEKGTNILSVFKYNSAEKTLGEAWKKLTSNRQLIEDFRIYSEGLTDFLSIPSYYEHSACTISKKNTETISFLFRGKASTFYLVSLQVITEKGYPDNIKELLSCAKSIKTLP